jgi:hypothetical protein
VVTRDSTDPYAAEIAAIRAMSRGTGASGEVSSVEIETDAEVVIRRYSEWGSFDLLRSPGHLTLRVDGKDRGEFGSIDEAVAAEPGLIQCAPRDEFEAADEAALEERLVPDFEMLEFPGERFDIWINGDEICVDLGDYGAKPQENASMETTEGSGGFAAVLFRVGPWLECWYASSDEPSWGWRIEGDFDPRASALRFFADAFPETGGVTVEYDSPFLSEDELRELNSSEG